MKITANIVELFILLGVSINATVGVLNYIANHKKRSNER